MVRSRQISFFFFLARVAHLEFFFFFSSRRRHTRFDCDWSSDVCSSDLQRLGMVLQDAGIKIDSVASSITTKSGRAMIEALIDGERRGPVLAQLARGKMRTKI